MSQRLILIDKKIRDLPPKKALIVAADKKHEMQNQKDFENTTKPRPIGFYLDDESFHRASPLVDYSLESTETNESNTHSGHRMFDLHGYTTNGAEESLRRIFTSVDRSRQQVIKINVGQGSHSQDGIAKLPEVVKKVAKDLQLPPPVRHEKNPGYLLMILPPIISTD